MVGAVIDAVSVWPSLTAGDPPRGAPSHRNEGSSTRGTPRGVVLGTSSRGELAQPLAAVTPVYHAAYVPATLRQDVNKALV